MNADFETFKNRVSHFFFNNPPVVFQSTQGFEPTGAFRRHFPGLAVLLEKARVITLTIKGRPYRLFSWTNIQNESCGWLSPIETHFQDLPFLESHLMLVKECGGIIEPYNDTENPNSLCLNQNFLFVAEYCEMGLQLSRIYYEEACTKVGCNPIETENLLRFAQHAGNNRYFYDPATEKVLVFAFEPVHGYFSLLPGHEEFTFYTIDGISTFSDFVETLAQQWLEWVV